MASRPTKPTETKPTTQAKAEGQGHSAANPPVTFDVNDPAFQAIVAQAVAVRLAALEAAKPAHNGKSEVATMNDAKCIRAFKKLGYKDVKPRENILTFNKWIELGFRPMEGSKSVKVANLRLFHRDQCRKLTADEVKQLLDAPAKARKDGGKVIPIGTSPQ